MINDPRASLAAYADAVSRGLFSRDAGFDILHGVDFGLRDSPGRSPPRTPYCLPAQQHDEHVRRYRFHLQYHDQIQARLRRELPVIHAAEAKRARKNEKRVKEKGL